MVMELKERYDIVVIGGGPAGSTLATFLTRKGYDVLVLEREEFPRFHVGESLLPSTQRIWDKLGIAEELQHLGNTFKFAGEFRLGKNPRSSEYDYTRNRFNNYPRGMKLERPYSYQVNRAEFDEFLLNNARKQGATVVEKAVVKEVVWEGDRATAIRWKKDGRVYTTELRMLADCSGRHAHIARTRKLLQPDPFIKTSSVFGHYRGVARKPGSEQGYFNGYFIENGWFWFIPLKDDIMSIGLVMNQPETSSWGKRSGEDILHSYMGRYQYIRDRMAPAEQVSDVRLLRGLPYVSQRGVGDGWLLAGDAFFFVDPLYSSGVEICFHTAELAADTIESFLSQGRDLGVLKAYEKYCFDYYNMVRRSIMILYRLLPHRFAMEAFVNGTGKRSNNWDNVLLRRVNAWGTGQFNRYHWAQYLFWTGSMPLIARGKIEAMLGKSGWSREYCQEPFEIPRAKDFRGRKPVSKVTKEDAHEDAHEDASPVNFEDRWVTPRILRDPAGPPAMA